MTTSDPVRWGILGTGGINRRFLGGMAQAEAARIVAVASRDADRGGGLRRGARDPDARTAPTRRSSRTARSRPSTSRCRTASTTRGRWRRWRPASTSCREKPYTRRPAEVDEGFDAAERAGRLLVEGFMWRYTPQTERLVEESRRIGPLRTIRVDVQLPPRRRDEHPPPRRRSRAAR